MTFKTLGLTDELIKAVDKLGFSEPTPIQEKAIPQLLQKKGDLIGLAQTGTGKTAAFGLPLLQEVVPYQKTPSGLIICPTRELCLQITKDLSTYAEFVDGIEVVAVYGGADIRKQIREIKSGVSIIVATPGRLVDLIKRKAIRLEEILTVILDEADEMLNMGFKEDLDFILEACTAKENTWLFSATMPKEVERIAKKYMKDPFQISIGNRNEANENIEHFCFVVKEKDRFEALKRLIAYNPNMYGLIFCRTRRETQQVAEKLEREGYKADAIHGDLSQAQRDRVMRRFRKGSIQLLVATDVASRGIDVSDITHVINYKLPDELESYTHRSGRTARAGNKGESLVLINSKEKYKIKRLEKVIGQKFTFGEVPGAEDVFAIRLNALAAKIKKTTIEGEIAPLFLPEFTENIGNLSSEDLLLKLITIQYKEFEASLEKSTDLNAGNDRRGKKGSSERRQRSDKDKRRFFVSLGKKDGLNPGGLLRLICDKSGLEADVIGKIDILSSFSFFDVDKDFADVILKKVQGTKFEDKRLTIEPADTQGKHKERGAKKAKRKRKSKKF